MPFDVKNYISAISPPDIYSKIIKDNMMNKNITKQTDNYSYREYDNLFHYILCKYNVDDISVLPIYIEFTKLPINRICLFINGNFEDYGLFFKNDDTQTSDTCMSVFLDGKMLSNDDINVYIEKKSNIDMKIIININEDYDFGNYDKLNITIYNSNLNISEIMSMVY